ncbi:hypothetical protein C8Q72DRAFT_817671 [Fomitopsis betulina]|nr:hypothetical protein C8Q72DRAFT_817671 [Fomitopsis betulina]
MPRSVSGSFGFQGFLLSPSLDSSMLIRSDTDAPIPEAAKFEFTVIPSGLISDGQFEESAVFFSTQYGIWGPTVTFSKPGSRVRMSTPKFKDQLIPDDQARTVLATCRVGDTLIGQAFATTWDYEPSAAGEKKIVGWITQLVVHKSYRRRGIATALLHNLLVSDAFRAVSILGVASSHPATCAAVARLAKTSMGKLDLDFIRTHASDVLAQTPIRYLRGAELHGSLFGDEHPAGAVSSVYTKFFIDHEEPLDALQTFKDADQWTLGVLHEGYEFLVVAPRHGWK